MTQQTQARGAPATARIMLVGSGDDLTSTAAAVHEAGHEVILAPDGKEALRLLDEWRPEAMLIRAPEVATSLLDFCQRVRRNRAAPSVLFVSLPSVGAPERKEVLRAGASHVFEAPLDFEEVVIRLDAALACMRDADKARASALVDPETGLYNAAGLARRGRELTAEAMRCHVTLACAVIGADIDNAAPTREASVRTAEALRARGRLSDVIGRVGPLEFVVLAPGTGAPGAHHLARRLSASVRSALSSSLSSEASGRIHAGYTALENLAYAPVAAGELVARATGALRSGRQAPYFEWLPASELERRPPA